MSISPPSSPPERAVRAPIAVVGMACRYAGASSPAQLWEVLRDGVDATSDTPADRYDVDALYSPSPQPGQVIGRRAGYVHDAAQFDAGFFGLSDEEARYLDPQQRLLMMTAWEALEDAGMPPDAVAGSRTGVYVGASYTDYADLVAGTGPGAADLLALYNFRSLLPARLSYLFDLRGPSISLDTACSSSLVAVHLACQSIRAGETTMALAAGVNVKIIPDRDSLFSQARTLAPDGRSKFGDADADGAGFSDGVGVVVLKPLDLALADGDRIHAVVLGSAVGNDGASSGSLLSPSVEGHVEMLRWAYADAGVDPAEVEFVEAHGNGTPMMDPVEFAGLNEVLGRNRPADRPCFVGSVKTNVGHTESAAGIAGLVKTVLCLQHRQVVPSLHFDTPNPDIAWDDIPFTVPTTVRPLPDRGRPAVAGISGQGLSSVNAHLVIGRAEPARNVPEHPVDERCPHLLALSARSEAALTDLVRAYIRYLEPGGAGSNLALRDICHSAATRRPHHDHRLAFVATTHPALADALRSHLSDEPSGRVIPYDDTARHEAVGHLAELYTTGQPVPWSDLTEAGARFVPLPTYPWQTSRYWYDTPPRQA